jgi:hypothetical protein
MELTEWELKWSFFGFAMFELPLGSFARTTWIVPYWSTAMSFALLSAYLLLSKPRRPKTAVKPQMTIR